MTVSSQWRYLDTGRRRAAENFAINRAILEAHQSGLSPNTLRFLGFQPSALVGFHQAVSQEIKLEYCREKGIDVQRRLTGGGALYFDEGVLGWELYLDKHVFGKPVMAEIARTICETVADGIRQLGVDARYRPRNDIEIDGRKISGTGGTFDGDSILYQGTLLMRFDVETMLNVLRIPAEKLEDKGITSARERITSLAEHLDPMPTPEIVKQAIAQACENHLGIRFETATELNDEEKVLYGEHLREIDDPEWVFQHEKPWQQGRELNGRMKTPGGLLQASVIYDPEVRIIRQVWLTGDYFVKPRRGIIDLESHLKDTPVSQLRSKIEQFFEEHDVTVLNMTPKAFGDVIEKAIVTGQEVA